MRTLLKKIDGWIFGKRRARRREQRILDRCGCVCFCPHCLDPLNDQARWTDADNDGIGHFACSKCGGRSKWAFGAPVPILMAPLNKT